MSAAISLPVVDLAPSQGGAGSIFPRYSASKLNLAWQCGARYKYRYIDHGPDLGSAVASLGTEVHAVLEAAATQWLEAGPVDGSPRYTRQQLVELAQQLQKSQEAIKYVAEHFEYMDFRHCVGAEQAFDLEINGYQLNGYIDRVDAHAYVDGPCVVIVDYKTGYKLEEYSLWQLDFQPRIYAVIGARIFRAKFGDAVPVKVRVEFFYTSLNKTVSLEYTPELETRLFQDIAKIDAKIKSGVFEESPGSWCGYCPRRAVCTELNRYLESGLSEPANLPLPGDPEAEMANLAVKFLKFKNIAKIAEERRKEIGRRLMTIMDQQFFGRSRRLERHLVSQVIRTNTDCQASPHQVAAIFEHLGHKVAPVKLAKLDSQAVAAEEKAFAQNHSEDECFELEYLLSAHTSYAPYSYIDVKAIEEAASED